MSQVGDRAERERSPPGAAQLLQADEWLDVGAENCGRLIGLVAGRMTRLAPGARLGVVAYDPSTQVDLPAWCRLTGHQLLAATPVEDRLEFLIRKSVGPR